MTQDLEPYIDKLLINYDWIKEQGKSRLLQLWPRLGNYSYFEQFILLNLIIICVYLLFSFISSFSIRSFLKKVTKIIYDLPPIKKKINEEMQMARRQILKEYPQNLQVKIDVIPYKPPIFHFDDSSQKDVVKGKKSGQRYALQSHSKFVCNLAKLFAYSNPLHVDVFPLIKQMEIQVIAMTADFIGLKNQQGKACGTLNSGGTESILMAIYAYREYGIKMNGVNRPNLVLCQTAHPAAVKACDYLDIEMRLIPCDNEFRINLSKMKSAIDSNTICVYTSYPNYPFGTADSIQVISTYCAKRGVPVHVDMCLGGFVVPFIQKQWKVPSGVTTISADPHKYGLAAKGVSVLLFSSEKYRKYQFFVTTVWPGGLYGTPGVAGSRSGVYIASAWISMMKMGRKGFQENAKIIYETLVKMSEELEKLEFQILSKDKISVLSFRHKKIPVNAIQTFMKEKGWGMSVTQKPLAFQFSFTPLSCSKSDQMIKDLKECISFYQKNPFPKEEAVELVLYGVCGKVKDDGKKNLILGTILDTFIDLC